MDIDVTSKRGCWESCVTNTISFSRLRTAVFPECSWPRWHPWKRSTSSLWRIPGAAWVKPSQLVQNKVARESESPYAADKWSWKRRLEQLIQKLEWNGQYKKYDSIIQEQLQEGVVEAAPEAATGKEFYFRHKGVIRENAESAKLRIVYVPRLERKVISHLSTTALTQGLLFRTICGIALWGPDATLYCLLATLRTPFFKSKQRKKREIPCVSIGDFQAPARPQFYTSSEPFLEWLVHRFFLEELSNSILMHRKTDTLS